MIRSVTLLAACLSLSVAAFAQQVDRPLPPFFLPCGTWDLLMGDSRRMLKALHQLGSTKSEAREYPRGPHAFHAFVMTPQALRCWKDTFSFLSTHV